MSGPILRIKPPSSYRPGEPWFHVDEFALGDVAEKSPFAVRSVFMFPRRLRTTEYNRAVNRVNAYLRNTGLSQYELRHTEQWHTTPYGPQLVTCLTVLLPRALDGHENGIARLIAGCAEHDAGAIRVWAATYPIQSGVQYPSAM